MHRKWLKIQISFLCNERFYVDNCTTKETKGFHKNGKHVQSVNIWARVMIFVENKNMPTILFLPCSFRCRKCSRSSWSLISTWFNLVIGLWAIANYVLSFHDFWWKLFQKFHNQYWFKHTRHIFHVWSNRSCFNDVVRAISQSLSQWYN